MPVQKMFEENVTLAPFTTMRVGGPARFFIRIKSADVLSGVLKFATEKNLPTFILGGGSNIVVSDRGWDGLVIKMEMDGEVFEEIADGMRVIVGAGVGWDHVVAETVSRGLPGLENLSAIPGSVGAAPVQNIGAYGREVKNFIEWVEVWDPRTCAVKKLSNKECDFRYRDSVFKHEGSHYIIMRVCFVLRRDMDTDISYRDLKKYFNDKGVENPNSGEVREAVISIRRQKLPDIATTGTAGSFFKNLMVTEKQFTDLAVRYPKITFFDADKGFKKIPLAWVLDKICGLKGYREGNVGLYEHQPLAVVNYGGASAREIVSFAEKIKNIVKEKIDIIPEYEVLLIGDFKF